MDIDGVDFHREPYDCAILLGNGHFWNDTECHLLFEEWLIPLCPGSGGNCPARDLAACELIHPRRIAVTGGGGSREPAPGQGSNLASGWQGVRHPEPGNMAATSAATASGRGSAAEPGGHRKRAACTAPSPPSPPRDGYYLVWPQTPAPGASISTARAAG